MSDTHSLMSEYQLTIPDGDVFIHAGDFTGRGKIDQVRDFNSWLGEVMFQIVYFSDFKKLIFSFFTNIK